MCPGWGHKVGSGGSGEAGALVFKDSVKMPEEGWEERGRRKILSVSMKDHQWRGCEKRWMRNPESDGNGVLQVQAVGPGIKE